MDQLSNNLFLQNVSQNSNNQVNSSYVYSQNSNEQTNNRFDMHVEMKENNEINKDSFDNKLNTNILLSDKNLINCSNVSNEKKIDGYYYNRNQIYQKLIEQGDIENINEQNENITKNKNKKYQVRVQNQPNLSTNNFVIFNDLDIEINLIGQQNFEHINEDRIEQPIDISQSDVNCVTLYKNEKQKIKVEYYVIDKLNTLLIKKTNEKSKIFNEYEQKILEKIKNENITLDFIDKMENNSNSYEQIAGKTDLYCLKQQNINRHVFELYFIILLGKLNKMHQLGIAHSDIKPSNIVISYENEPYFIDFDCSVFISDYSEYFLGNTFKYNLNIYFEKQSINNKTEFIAIKFKNEEEIKLCDKTQLALTFLYLFCENQKQLNLFSNKKFNELFRSQYEKIPKTENERSDQICQNKLYTLYIINNILNEADSNIKLIDQTCFENYILIIDFVIINKELEKTLDIVFDEKKNVYIVKRIDKFSIKLIYLMDKLGFDLEINLQKYEIIPQLQTKEYKYIYKKYLVRYYYQFIKSFDSQFYFNRSEYIKTYSDTVQICIKYYSVDNRFKLLFESIQNLVQSYSFVINLMIDSDFSIIMNFYDFIKDITNYLSDFYISNFEKDDNLNKWIFKLNRHKNEIKMINIKFNSFEILRYQEPLTMYVNYIKDYIKSKHIYLTLYFSFGINDFINSINLKKFNIRCLINLVNKTLEKVHLTYKFNYFLQIQKTHNQQQQKFNKIENKNFISQSCFTNFQEQKFLLFSDTEFDSNKESIELCEKGESIIVKTLQDQFKDKNQIQSIILKFNDFFFIRNFMWEELKEILKNEENKLNKMILINCFFSKEVVELLENIKSVEKQVKYEYYDDYIESLDDKTYCIDDEIKQRYSFSIQYCSDTFSQQGLIIQFFKYFSQKKNQLNYQSDYVENEQNKNQKKKRKKLKLKLKIKIKIKNKNSKIQKTSFNHKICLKLWFSISSRVKFKKIFKFKIKLQKTYVTKKMLISLFKIQITMLFIKQLKLNVMMSCLIIIIQNTHKKQHKINQKKYVKRKENIILKLNLRNNQVKKNLNISLINPILHLISNNTNIQMNQTKYYNYTNLFYLNTIR